MQTTHTNNVHLVTGGTGMLGRAIVEQLLERHHRVRIVDLKDPEHPDERVEVLKGDIRDEQLMRQALQDVDTVYHVAAAVWSPGLPKRTYEEVNVQATAQLLKLSRELHVPRFVYTSTMDVVMDGVKGETMADETLPYPADTARMNAYAISKMKAEQLVLAANSPELSTCALRMSGLFGPGDQYHLPGMLRAAKGALNVRLGNGSAKFSHLYSGNAAHAHVLAAANLRPGSSVAGQVYFISDGHDGNFFDFMSPYLQAMNFPPYRLTIPHRAAATLAGLVEKIAPTSDFNRDTVYFLCLDHTYSYQKATRDFSYQPRYTPQEAFDQSLAWLKTQRF